MKDCNMKSEPKMQALEELAKAMAALKLDKLKGYKKNAAVPVDEEVDELDPVADESEEEVPAMDSEDEVEAEEDTGPKGFSQVLEAIAKKKAKKH